MIVGWSLLCVVKWFVCCYLLGVRCLVRVVHGLWFGACCSLLVTIVGDWLSVVCCVCCLLFVECSVLVVAGCLLAGCFCCCAVG